MTKFRLTFVELPRLTPHDCAWKVNGFRDIPGISSLISDTLLVSLIDLAGFINTSSQADPCERNSPVPNDSGSEGHLSMEFGSEVSSFLSVTPTIWRLFVREVDMATNFYEARRRIGGVNQGGSFSCPRWECCDVLPTREAYTCHIHIHLIHEGYVFRAD